MRHRRAFTLVELLVVVAFIALLVGIALPVASRAREKTHLEACTNTLRSMMSATGVYAGDTKDALPNGMNSPWAKGTCIGASYFVQVTHGDKQICGVGQLMWGKYLPEKRQAIACPQTDLREDKGFNTNCWMPIVNYTSTKENDASNLCFDIALDPSQGRYYRNVYSSVEFGNYYTTYAIRGPALKLSDRLRRTPDEKSDLVKPADFAFWADHECADQKLIPKVGTSASPLIGWGRVHPEGINTAYLDGHVAMFKDEDRSKTWGAGEVCNYGNSSAMHVYDLDYSPPKK